VKKKVTIAFVGVAHIHTPGFIALLKSRNDVKGKIYLGSRFPPRAEKRAHEIGAAVASDLRQVWADPEIAAVVICSETNRHHDLVMAAAKAGKHMFVEKPLGITGKESVAMAEAIENAKVRFTTGYFSARIRSICFSKIKSHGAILEDHARARIELSRGFPGGLV